MKEKNYSAASFVVPTFTIILLTVPLDLLIDEHIGKCTNQEFLIKLSCAHLSNKHHNSYVLNGEA